MRNEHQQLLGAVEHYEASLCGSNLDKLPDNESMHLGIKFYKLHVAEWSTLHSAILDCIPRL